MHVTWCSSLLSPPFLKGGIVIASARLSVRPSVCMLCSILHNHWTKSNQVWCAKFSYEWVVRQHFFGAIPLGPRGGFKGQLSYLKSQFQRFLYQTLCLFSKIKEWDFHYVAWVVLQGWDLGLLGVILFSKHGRVAYQIEWGDEQNGIQVKFSPYGQTCDLEV